MNKTLVIRRETSADYEQIRELNRAAFGVDTEANLVDDLRAGGHIVVSSVAELDGNVVGHVLFCNVLLESPDGESIPALSLGPISAHPDYQRQGIGSSLLRAAIASCRDAGHRIVVVLGHPDYYPRFGFSPTLAEPLTSPFGSGEIWMALELQPGSLDGVSGAVRYPEPFQAFLP